MKLRVIKKTETEGGKDDKIVSRKTAIFDANQYKSFGQEGQNAHKEGWMPQEFILQKEFTPIHTIMPFLKYKYLMIQD